MTIDAVLLFIVFIVFRRKYDHSRLGGAQKVLRASLGGAVARASHHSRTLHHKSTHTWPTPPTATLSQSTLLYVLST